MVAQKNNHIITTITPTNKKLILSPTYSPPTLNHVSMIETEEFKQVKKTENSALEESIANIS